MTVYQIVKDYKSFLGECVEIKKILMVFSVSSTILRSEKQLISNMIDNFREECYARLREIEPFEIRHPILNFTRSCLEQYFIKISKLCDIISSKKVMENEETNTEDDIPFIAVTSIG